MKMLGLILLALVLAVAGFFFGRMLAQRDARAQVVVHNRSGQQAVRIELAAASGPLADGASRTLDLGVRGEAGYDVRVTWADGTASDAKNLYVEGGGGLALTLRPDRTVQVE